MMNLEHDVVVLTNVETDDFQKSIAEKMDEGYELQGYSITIQQGASVFNPSIIVAQAVMVKSNEKS